MEFFKSNSGDIFHYASYQNGWRVFKNGVPLPYGKTKLIKCKSQAEARGACLNCTGGNFYCNATSYEEVIRGTG